MKRTLPAFALLLASAQIAAATEKAAVLVCDNLKAKDMDWVADDIVAEEERLEKLGYRVMRINLGDIETLVKVLKNDDIKAVSFFGHNTDPDAKPSIQEFNAEQIRNEIRADLYKKYRGEQKLSREETEKRIDAFSFEKKEVRGYSCHSLNDTSLADLLVKPGGSYFGTANRYTPTACNPLNLVWTDHALTEHTVISSEITEAAFVENLTHRIGELPKERYEALMGELDVTVPTDFYKCLCYDQNLGGVGGGMSYENGKCQKVGVLGGRADVKITGPGNQGGWERCLDNVLITTPLYPDGARMQDILMDRIREVTSEDAPPPPAPAAGALAEMPGQEAADGGNTAPASGRKNRNRR